MKKKQKIKKKNIIILIVIIILLVIFVISLTNIINWKKDNDDNLKIQKDLNQYIKKDEEYKIDFKALKEKNSDVVAYLEVPNTNIKYIVVKGKDNDYYLKHNFNKEYNNTGWIFADYRNKFNFTDYNIVIYGHNTRGGSMFGTLKKVLNEDWYSNKSNHEVVLVTENKVYKYRVFSVYEDKASDYPITTEFKNDNEYLTFLNTVKKKSKYNFNVDVSVEKSILTLSTCATNNQNRVILHAINIK